MINLIIEMSGGVLQAVYADDKDVKYTIVDHDEENAISDELEPDGLFETDEKEALLNYLTNYAGTTEDSY